MSFPLTLVHTKGARLVPESIPTFKHFWPALAAKTESAGTAAKARDTIMQMDEPNFVFIT
ncbi:MAG: hypothetical protein NTX25_17320 [Proteobacteria bacterium]|nr:hypothetical protein [Pseudomonadota bacterium]